MSEAAAAQNTSNLSQHEREEGSGVNSNNLPVPKKLREKQKRLFINGISKDETGAEEPAGASQLNALPPRNSAAGKVREVPDAPVMAMSQLIHQARQQSTNMLLMYGVIAVIVVGAVLGIVLAQVMRSSPAGG